MPTAAQIIADQRQVAREEAERVIAPVTQQTHQSQLQANIQWMQSLKTADGQALEAEFINDTVRSIYGALPKEEALKVLADPKVAQVVGYVALGRQASLKKGAAAPPPAPGPALHVESAGGSSEVRISDGSRALFSKAGISEKDALASAKKFKPGVSNVLE
jgi:virulence-associated protein VagC